MKSCINFELKEEKKKYSKRYNKQGKTVSFQAQFFFRQIKCRNIIKDFSLFCPIKALVYKVQS